MAVSFKVPKSPKRSIFNIDNFLGVDLTNSGANIEETRSPNAENMVRYVPGKVRKRTGYEKDVIFGKDINVNYVKDTTSQEREFIFKAGDTGKWIKIYDVIQRVASKDGNAYDLYYEFDYMSTAKFWISWNTIEVPSSEGEWAHFSLIRPMAATDVLSNISVWTNVEQDIYIKNLSVMRGKDANYKWTPAPNYFVERANNDPVYGVHVAKTGTFEGNRVVNVNRALLTSDTFATLTVDSNWQVMYSLGEVIYPNRKFYVEFDYKLTGDPVNVWSSGNHFATLQPTATTEHYSGSASALTSYGDNVQIAVASGGTSATLEIRNFSLMYQIDHETYDWSAAPEDNGGTFPLGDTFLVGSKNYAIIDTIDDQGLASSGTYTQDFAICDSSSNVEGYAHIKFNLHTSSYDSLTNVKVQIVSDQNSTITVVDSAEHINSETYDIYSSTWLSGDYFKTIRVTYTVGGNHQCWTYITGIEVNGVEAKTSYDVSTKWYIYHVGTDFYLRASNSDTFTKIYNNANQHLSKAWQFNKTLYILDGKDIYAYASGDETITPISEEAGYIPTVTIAKEQHGGGVPYEPLNMLQPGFIEMFQGQAGWQMFFLSFGHLDQTPVRAWVLSSSGTWVEKFEGTDFTVNRQIGMVDFINSPGASPITGEDNVKIQAYRTVPGYRERITNCTNGTLFGVGGAEDRLFLTGNPDYPNWDFYSEQYNPTYFPDTGYSALGSEQSAIVGYAIVNNYLAAFKDGFDTSQSVFIREGDLVVDQNNVSQPAFKLINTLQGNGVVAPYAFGYLTQEPLFLTKSGIYAITAQDITGEKYSQNRSFYLNGALKEEEHLENAVATVFDDQYILALNNKLYILDGLQATRTDRSEPYSTRQYVGFQCKDVPAVCIWTDNDALWFGTGDGRVCRFHTDIEALESYNDDGYPIYSCWETPDLDGQLFYKNKTFRYFAIRMMKVLRTSVKLYSKKLGSWSFIKEDNASGVVFDFENIDFDNFSFSTDSSEKVVHTKVRVKKVDKARFRVENDKLNEPFGLYDLALEYVERGNYKG